MTSALPSLHDELGLPVLARGVASEVDAFLAEACAAAEGTWPGVVVERRRFVRYLAERVDPRVDVLSQLRDLRLSDLYLACACSHRVPNAMDSFERAFLHPLDGVLERLGANPAMIDEVKQVLRIHFFVAIGDEESRIRSYAGRGDMKHWVRASAVRAALKQRAEPTKTADDSVLDVIADARQDLELDFLKRTYREAFDAALRDAFQSLAPRERNLLRFYFVRGLSIDQIGAIYHVHRVTISRRVRAANETLVDRTRTRLAVRLGIDPTDVSSILRIVRSEYERSLRSILASA